MRASSRAASPIEGTCCSAQGDLACDTPQATFVRFVQGTDSGTACEPTIVDGWTIEYENEPGGRAAARAGRPAGGAGG